MGTTRKGIWMPASDEVLRKVENDAMIHLLDHPIVQHKVTLLRNLETGTKDVNELVREVGAIMLYEMTAKSALQKIHIQTPMVETDSLELSGKKPALVKILRAGSTMVDGARMFTMPSAKVATIGMHRNPDDITQPVGYFDKVPVEMDKREAFILDPMLATGYSADKAIQLLKGVGCTKIHFACIFSVWEGIAVLRERHPDVDLYLGAVDAGLDENYYIIPGAGDMGDRLDGTK